MCRTGPSLQGFTTGRSCLANLTSYDKVIHSVDEGKDVDVFLGFSKVFDTIIHSIILKEVAACGLYGCTVHGAKYCLKSWD